MQFNAVPTNDRVPFTFVEFSNTEAASGLTAQPYSILLMGQKLSSGTQAPLTPVRIQSKAQAKTLFGAGSMLAAMASKAIDANNSTPIWAVAMVDDAAGVTAKSTLVVNGPATSDGTIALYIGDKVVNVGVLSGDTAAAIATKIAAAILANGDLFLSGPVDGTSPTHILLEAKNKGAFANGAPVSLNYNGETLPAGVTLTIPALSGGTTNPDLTAAISAIGDEQYQTIVTPYTDAANLKLIEDELARRWGPAYTNDGHAFTATQLDSAAAASLGLTRNSPFLTILENVGSPTTPWEAAAVLGATVAFESPIDQARPLQTVILQGIAAPRVKDRLIMAERNVLLYAGISTTKVDSGGNVRLERVITTYKTDASGNPDESYLDYEKMAILSYLRYSFRVFFGNKYPRHKLAKDGTRFAPGAAVMTPKLAKAEAIGIFADWEYLGLVEDHVQFERDIIVEINALNSDRLDFYLPPNLIGALRIIAAQIAFRS